MNWTVTRCPHDSGQWRYQVLAPDSGEELGRCWVVARPDEPALFSGLYVEPAWRRQGVARALLQQVLVDCAATGVVGHADPFGDTRGLSHLMLCRFYRRHGATVSRTGRCAWLPKTFCDASEGR